MAKYQVPENLIDQVQILLRKEALLEFFNPNDPSIPPLPTLDEAVAGIGASDHQLRCKYCRGELLRGSESIICVYCGRRGQQQEEPPPQPIAFKTTLGFGWLLQSLRLDGSESVGPPIGGTQSNRGQSSLKDQIALSDFLNLELKWPDESKRFGMINEAQLAGERSLTLVGVDLNDLIPEKSSDIASSACSKQPVTSKNTEIIENTTLPRQRNLDLFEESKSSESALRSNEGENDEAFSGWEAEFQSADPDAGHTYLQSFEAAKGPLPDNPSHINSVQGHVEVKKSENMPYSHAHPGSDLTNEDLDVNFEFPSLSKQPEGNILVEDVGKVFDSGDASTGLNWRLDDQQKTTTAEPSHIMGRVGDDSSDQWNDFRILTDLKKNRSEPNTTILPGTENSGPDVSDGWNDFIGSVGGENNKPKPDDDSLDAWNSFRVSSSVNEVQQDQQDIHADTPQSKTFSQDDSIGLWSSSLSTVVLDDQFLSSGDRSPVKRTTKEADDSFNLWNDFKSAAIETQQVNNIEGADNKMSGRDDRTIDVWDDFASLGANNSEQQISNKKAINGDRNGSSDISFASLNDNSFNAWNDLTSSVGISVDKSIGNDMSFGEWQDFSSSTVTHTDHHQSSGKKADDSQTVLEDDDSFGSWSNLRSSGMQIENSFPCIIATESSQDKISMEKDSGGLKSMKDDSPFDAWSNFGQPLPMSDKASPPGEIELSADKPTGDVNDFFSGWSDSGKKSTNLSGDQLNTNGVKAHDGKSDSENDDSFDAWTEFTSSSNVPVNQSLRSSANAPGGEEAIKNDDIFDSWNVFSSSFSAQAGTNSNAPKESMLEISLFSTNTNSQGVECSSSSQQDLLLGVFSDRNGTSQEAASSPEVPDVVRIQNGGGKAEADGRPEKLNQSETSSRGNSELKSSDVETLISEMHDLSFMLENTLSIPKSWN